MQTEETKGREESLYKRLGGYDAIAAVVDDYIRRIVEDKQLNRFFMGHSTDSKNRIRQQMVEFICNAAEGPCNYTGRDLYIAHSGLSITEDDWEIGTKLLIDTLNKFNVSEKEKETILNVVSDLKDDIVELE